jgi:septal ring factor EnvC (AmiA/AmiB activator)
MDTTLNPKQTDPPHVLIARADEEFAHAHEQIARAGEEIARAEEQLSKLEHDAARPAVPGKRPLFDSPAVRGFTGLLLAACIGVAAIAWQSPYGDAAKIIARSAPQLVLTSSLPLENLGLPAQPSPPTVQAAAAQTAPPQPAPLAQTAPEDAAAALAPELTQLLQSMARDIATLGQAIEQLKASQAQMARDNANAAEQLKASREQMARVIARASEARASEQNLRPRISTSPPRPTATPTRRPVPTS